MKRLFIVSTFSLISSLVYAQVDSIQYQTIKDDILRETKPGGKLDFFTPIKGHEYDGVQIKPGLFTTKLGIALMHWGEASHQRGVAKIEDALLLFSQHKGRELNLPEKEYIKMGFNGEFDK